MRVIFGALAFAVFPFTLYGEERIHVVQRGETLFSIARSQGMRAEDLMRHNGITDPSRLLAGQRLRIPSDSGGSNVPTAVPQAATQAVAQQQATAVRTHRIVRGETLFGLARRFSVTVDALRRFNNLAEGHVLREGDLLRLPPEAVIPVEAIAAQVVPQIIPANQVRAETAQSARLDTQVIWPIAAREVRMMTGKLSGVVITGTQAEPVRSLTRGTVLSAGPYRGFGMVVIIQVEGGYLYVYGGSESLSVREGDLVGPGTELGRLGVDAATNEPKLFFMVYRGNIPVDPARAPRG
ncbi:MAG: LysM peptidoglycan-binding domain-containing M23 family metallopeptidase [Treponema sp.]|nr:LysM peptidoglycan-binding domain-containing M23 family metallopeptidase [Treponema sp.]